jgi:hypothetical protein
VIPNKEYPGKYGSMTVSSTRAFPYSGMDSGLFKVISNNEFTKRIVHERHEKHEKNNLKNRVVRFFVSFVDFFFLRNRF